MLARRLGKTSCKYLLGCALFCSVSFAQALSLEDARLLQKENQQYQAWVLARDYYFGTTQAMNRIKALAWQLIYVNDLPVSYPQKDRLLSLYKESLSAGQIAAAGEMADHLRKRYKITEPFTEDELYRVYILHQDNVDIPWNKQETNLPPAVVWSNFSKWLDWLVQNNQVDLATQLEDRKRTLLKQHTGAPLVYGQVIVKGPASVKMVNTQVKLSPEGYFVDRYVGKTLSFSLAGYQTRVVPIEPAKPVQGLAPILLEMPETNQKTGVVGRVLPWAGFEKSNMILRLVSEDNKNQSDPWYHPAVNLTVTGTGQFYATGLVPGRYELFINTAGLSTSKQFNVAQGEIRGLSIIDLRKYKK